MRSKKLLLFTMILWSVLMLTSCSGGETTIPEVANDVSTITQNIAIVADGHLVPNRYIYLSFISSGKVEEILVEEGQGVLEGQILARLEGGIALDAQIAQAEYELLSAKRALELATGKDRESAEARVTAAELKLEVARGAFKELEILAPFTGTVVDVDLFIREYVTSGKPAILVADFTEWFVETENLTEIEVVNVHIGQEVTLTPDALPEISMSGIVVSISNVFKEIRGDITYVAKISIPSVDTRMRWGMTVAVIFED